MSTAAISPVEPAGASRALAFGSLVDLARMQIGTPSAEICDACNTINMGSARHCKCCSHKLPAFYAAAKDNAASVSLRDTVLPWHSLGMPDRASVMDFAAFSVVINVLVLITASIPIP
jgi:hypothetical protein